MDPHHSHQDGNRYEDAESIPAHHDHDVAANQFHHGEPQTAHSSVCENIVGTPNEDAKHWELQTTPFSCDVECQRGIIEALTGEHVSEAQLCTEAAERGWLSSSDGTSIEDSGKLLELHGVSTHAEMNARIGDIYEELSAGHKVIVGVRGQDLWDAGNPFALPSEGAANHAIWVTGIDKSDPADVKVIINDSGDPDGAGKAYSLSDFTNAWGKSDYFYLATDKAPPGLHDDVPDFDPGTQTFPDMVNWAHDHLSVADSVALVTALVALRAGTTTAPPSTPSRRSETRPITSSAQGVVEANASQEVPADKDTGKESAISSAVSGEQAVPPLPATDSTPQASYLANDIRKQIERNVDSRRRRSRRDDLDEGSDASLAGQNVVKLKARR